MQGRITKLRTDRGFGFIRSEEGEREYFFHRSAVVDNGYDQLYEGQLVSFDPEDSPKGPRANHVRPV